MVVATSSYIRSIVPRHYALKYEQWFQDNNGAMNTVPSIPNMGSGMAPGPGGMQIPIAMAMANMAMAGGGYYGGPGPGVYGPMSGPMMMNGPPLGMGMPPGGQINPLLMHDVGMFQGMGMHNDNNSIANHIYGERDGRGRVGGANGRVARF